MRDSDWWCRLTASASDAGLWLVGLSIRDPLPSQSGQPDQSGQSDQSGWPRLPRLCVRDELHQVVVGPLQRTGRPGCPGCADLRRWSAQPRLLGLRRLREDHGHAEDDPDQNDETAAGWARSAYGPIRTVLRALLLDEIEAVADSRPARTDRHVLTVRLNGQVRRHPLVPHPHCEHCADVAAAYLSSGPSEVSDDPLSDRYTVRRNDLCDAYDHWFETVVDDEFGVLGEPFPIRDSTVPATASTVGITPGYEPEVGWGRAVSRRQCHVIGAAEALERLGGMIPGSKAELVASYRDLYRALGDRALDPERLGLYPEERHRHPDFPFVHYHPDRPMSWTPGWSVTHRRPALVPTSYAYFRYFRGIGGVTGGFRPPHPDTPDAPFVFHISNGTALGSSFDEAVFHALLEIVERDAFLLTWYARLPIPEVELESARDRRLVALAVSLRERTGFRIRCYDNTLDIGIPSVWMLAQDERNGRHLAAAGAGLWPENAATAALVELAANLESVPRLAEAEPERAAALAADPTTVRVMLDHSMGNLVPGAAERFDFLTDRPDPTRGFPDVERSMGWPDAHTVEQHLAEALRRFDRHGLEVIAVDATRSEHRAVGLRCVKVIVPGTLPMTFGHWFRRTDGLPRLLSVPYDLGFAEAPLVPDQLRTVPHPFP